MAKRFSPAHSWIIPAKPGYSNKFWAVCVYETLDEMNGQIRFWTKGTKLFPRARLGGACITFSVNGHPEFLGFVLFAKERFGVGVVEHEMLHAASETLRLRNKVFTQRREERLALLSEYLVQQFWRKWYRYAEHSQSR